MILLAFFACVKDEPLPQPDIIVPRTVAKLPDIIYESSGIHVSAPNIIWTHNDSGHTNDLFQIDTTGQLVRTLRVANATNIDWEDLAVDNQRRVYINDAGNNNNNRRDLVIYRIPDPDNISGDVVMAERIDFVFEDQTEFPPPPSYRNYCIEAIIWKDDSIFMFTKDRSNPITGYTKMYAVPAIPGEHVAVLLDSLFVDNENHPARITAADYNPNTGEMVLLTRTGILSFTDYPGNRFFDGKIIDYQFSHLIGQVEAIAFVDNRRIFITSEGSSSMAGNLYEVILP
ncbi:MAG: hypothetical protein EA394_10030 [Bacteroidia bacterium]|nr:MAG: hypothetical protein EA394_10030 [Bacteroidia bacterium]